MLNVPQLIDKLKFAHICITANGDLFAVHNIISHVRLLNFV